jgi:hypothetical protein
LIALGSNDRAIAFVAGDCAEMRALKRLRLPLWRSESITSEACYSDRRLLEARCSMGRTNGVSPPLRDA